MAGTQIKSFFTNPQEESSYLKFLMKEKYRIFENNDENQKRIDVLNSIKQLINKWQEEYATSKKKTTELKNADVYSFGSFRMGVHFP